MNEFFNGPSMGPTRKKKKNFPNSDVGVESPRLCEYDTISWVVAHGYERGAAGRVGRERSLPTSANRSNNFGAW